MSTNPPLVSIIIPAYNAEKFLAEAVRSALAQVHNHLEVIIIDDGSTDGTAELATGLAASDPRVRVVRQPNQGLSSARNAGMRHARGDFLSFLDSDDTLHPLKVSRQVAALENSNAGLVFSDYYTTDEELVPLAIHDNRPRLDDVRDHYPFGNLFPPHAAMVPREIVEIVGEFDETLLSSEDWDYWLRCGRVAPMFHLPGALCSYRIHGEQMHNNRPRMRSSQLQVIRKNYPRRSLERRLAMAGFQWGEAKYQYARKNRWRALFQLAKVLAHARTPRHVFRVVRLARFG